MVIENPDAMNVAAANAGDISGTNNMAHPSGIPQDQIDNIMSGIANTGDVKMNNHRKKLRQRFDIIKKLGQGTYGKVQLGINKETGQEVAIKTIKKCKIEAEADLVRIRREVQIMSSVQHPNIIHIYEVFENREKMVLVMEFAAGGELYDYLSERKVLTEEEARRIFRQVATAVYYCHKHKICHRDLKLENILLDEHGNAKIADFGLSNVFDDQRMLATFCGSPLYASPEIVEGTPYQGPEVDCWSLGVLLYTLVYGSMPFDGSNFKRLVKQISQGDYYEPKKPSRASTLIRDMLTVCPRKRATIEQICSHWWVNENDNVSCLDLAEDLANQTPVRLDVLLSLTPAAVTADQLVVPSADGSAAGKGVERVPRSHSVGSIRNMGGNTEAERRILDMVAAGGEAALMPSPTRTITPVHSPVQTKRKLETTVSTENALVAQKKKEKPGSSALVIGEETTPLDDSMAMNTDDGMGGGVGIVEEPQTPAVTTTNASRTFSHKDIQRVGDLCEQLIQDKDTKSIAAVTHIPTSDATTVPPQKTVGKLDSVVEGSEDPAAKSTKKVTGKHKTIDVMGTVDGGNQVTTSSNKHAHEQTPPPAPTTTAAAVPPRQSETIAPAVTETAASATTTAVSKTSTPATAAATTTPGAAPFVRKCSLPDEAPLNKFNAERRKSRILETAEKFQQMNAGSAVDKPKKVSIPGVSVGSFKKEYERKASTTNATPSGPTAGERRALEEVAAAAAAAAELESVPDTNIQSLQSDNEIEGSDSKNSVASLSLEEARRSLENSIALLRQEQTAGSTSDVDQLCAQTKAIGVSDTTTGVPVGDRERKLKNARAIIGNAIQPVIHCRQETSTQALSSSIAPIASASLAQLPSPFFGRITGGGFGSVTGTGTGADDTNIYSHSNGISSSSGGGGGGVGYGVIVDGGGGRGVSFDSSKRFNNSISYAHQQPLPTISMVNQTVAASSPAIAVPATAIEKATARQTIMERLSTATGVGDSDIGYGFKNLYASRTHTPVNATNTNTGGVCSGGHYRPQLQKQQSLPHQQHLHQQQQQLPQFMHQHPHHQRHLSIGPSSIQAQPQSPSSLASAIIAAAATKNTKKSNAVPITTINTNITTNTTTTTTNNNNNINSTIQNSVPKPFYNASMHHPSPTTFLKSSPGDEPPAGSGNGAVKTSTASITLKSATLPRRKAAKTEIQLDIKPRIVEQPSMRFTTEMQHPVADLRSAPAREGPLPYSPIKTTLNARATSLEPKEHIIPIQRQQPPYTRTTSNTTNRSGSLSRQSTVDSESDTTTNLSHSTLTGSSQPIKKSPREFIIPIAMEGGGFITPREGSIEPSDSSHTPASSRNTFTRLRPTRRIGSLLSEASIDENLPFEKMRTASVNRDGDEDTRFTLHKLRSSRPLKKVSQDNDSQSSGEEDDDDGFEILTAENLFSTLLQRVRALTNRMNVNNDLTAGFPSSTRLLGNMRQAQSPFWNQEPFGRSQVSYSYSQTVEKKHVRLNNSGAPWRHSMSRDFGNDMESMFSRTGATLPRGNKAERGHQLHQQQRNTTGPIGIDGDSSAATTDTIDINALTVVAAAATTAGQDPSDDDATPLDLADLDLSRLRLSKKDLETLSNIAPGLPKCFQEQLLAKLPPTQARKLSRTLSMQNSQHVTTVKVYKRSQSSGRGALSDATVGSGASAAAAATTSLHPPSSLNEEPSKEAEKPSALRSQFYRRSLSRPRYETTLQQQQQADITATTSSTASTTFEMPKSRSNSVCRDDYSKSLVGSTYGSCDMTADKYRYQSPYLSRSLADSGSGAASPQRRYLGASSANSVTLPRDASAAGRPPSGCLSPDASGSGGSLRRPGSHRRISRFLRPDFFDEPLSTEETGQMSGVYHRDKKQRDRERESQSLLRDIREKSRESSIERYCDGTESGVSTADTLRRKYQQLQQRLTPNDCEPPEQLKVAIVSAGHAESHHARNRSLDAFDDQQKGNTLRQQHRRSLSRPRDISEELDKHELADKILQELQLLSAVRSQQVQRLSMAHEEVIDTPLLPTVPTPAMPDVGDDDDATTYKEKTSTIKKVKKLKPKPIVGDLPPGDNCCRPGVGGDDLNITTSTTTTTTVVKKVKKIVKKSNGEAAATATTAPSLATPEDMTLSPVSDGMDAPKKESKLKRPKSYPTKDVTPTAAASTVMASAPSATTTITTITSKSNELPNARLNSRAPLAAVEGSREELDTAGDLTIVTATNATTATATSGTPRESRLVRPKSYPASKLTPPKTETKKAIRNGVAIPNSIADVNDTKGDINVPNGESGPTTTATTVKKVIKKKSKLMQPTPVTPTSPSTSGIQMPITIAAANEGPREFSPTLKEKSPEKKAGKGLLYAIGQKFEKLRDSAKKSSSSSGGAINVSASGGALGKKSSPDNCSPEKIKEKCASALLTKKKGVKTDKSANASASTATTVSGKEATKTANGNIGTTANQIVEKPAKADKRSRIDAMIRSLRERSVPRCHTTSESNYLKRAVSVEDMPDTFNRNAVNKVLGLFRRFEKDGGGDRRVRNTRSTSNIERQMRDDGSPSRSSSPIYQNAIMEARNGKMSEKTAKSTASAKPKGTKKSTASDNCGGSCDDPNPLTTSNNCPDCQQHQAALAAAKTATATATATTATNSQMVTANGNKDKRKGLMLDLDGKAGDVSVGAHLKTDSRDNYMPMNGNGIYSNLPPYPGAIGNATTAPNASDNNNSSSANITTATNNNNNNNNNAINGNNNNSLHLSLNTNTNSSINSTTNNNTNSHNNNNNNTSSSQTSGYRTSSAHEINRNHLLTPSTENMANYSSDSRSYQDDCASTSTFLSPTEEPELCFDNWSICSEDNYMLYATPSPTVSRLSRTSQHSPTRCDSSDPNESVIERIKRRSFYCRFNDRKPRRTSSIVGPAAVRDYYREQQQHRTAAAATIAAVVGKTHSNHRLAASGGGSGGGGASGKRATSPDITHEFFRPLKLSPVGTELKPPVYRSPHEYSSSSSVTAAAAAASATASMRKSRKSLTDIRATPISTSSSFRRYGIGIGVAERDDYLSGNGAGGNSSRYKSSSSNSPYETNGDSTLGASSSGYYSTYNPKRRSSYTLLNGSVGDTKPHNATSSSTIDSYATYGRRSVRAYDQRTRSLLDPHTIAASGGSSTSTYLPRRDTRTPVRDYTTSMNRSANTRYRTSSMSRSPTNI